MIEYNQAVPMKYRGQTDLAIEYLKFYFKEKWLKDIHENLRDGYKEMGQINLSLSEVGLEQDIIDLYSYESMLLGREGS
ncbi:hypothetical protein [Wansuia hejianensis]|uniref:Uncharacterized protein n=1 Tax=Wansuia hejianensis TaxID=2763667 RepID=A0A926F0P0_9FIRM|nr:hypothetical protein [Wansuia hejianensis]MBC8589735.1 hypothetical protein [Wansuia hejianensis]